MAEEKDFVTVERGGVDRTAMGGAFKVELGGEKEDRIDVTFPQLIQLRANLKCVKNREHVGPFNFTASFSEVTFGVGMVDGYISRYS